MLYANTDDGSSALWVCDEDGIVIDNISYSIGERAPILEVINEHYGTSFTGWSDNEIALQVGATIPDWNEYEKIEGPAEKTLVAVKQHEFAPTAWYGELIDNTFYFATKENGAKIVFASWESGTVMNIYNFDQSSENTIFQSVRNSYPECNAISGRDVTESVGDAIPNWADYDILNPV